MLTPILTVSGRMEVIMSETLLEKYKGRVSYHDSVEEMLIRIRDDGLSKVLPSPPVPG
jgi:hypothetical protein